MNAYINVVIHWEALQEELNGYIIMLCKIQKQNYRKKLKLNKKFGHSQKFKFEHLTFEQPTLQELRIIKDCNKMSQKMSELK